jgi:hypothetical protein
MKFALHYPRHIDGFVVDASSRLVAKVDDYHFGFQLRCRCGANKFRIYRGTQMSIMGRCSICGHEFFVYNLRHYPAAVKPQGEELFDLIRINELEAGQVFVVYEYGEFDEDQPYDQDDITCCTIWIEDGNKNLIKVFNHETA